MNKYDAIDPEFLSEKTDDGLDFVKYMTYITTLESRLPQMVAQCTHDGGLDEPRLRALLDDIKCNYGHRELIDRVMVRLLRDTLGIDFQPFLDEADARYPMGKHPVLVTIAVQHRGEAEKAQALLEEKGIALDKSRETVEHQWTAPQGQPAKAKAKASENSENSENSETPDDGRPATKEDLYAYYSERALEALKKMKPKLMSSLAMAMPDKDARSMFIDSIPAPNDCDELVNTLFRPACDCGAMKPAIARELTWSDYIYDLLDFPKPVKPQQVDRKIKAFFDSYLTTKK